MGRDIHVVLERKTPVGWEYFDPHFTAFELNDIASLANCLEKHPVLRERGLTYVASSDAHYLTDIAEEGFAVEIDDQPYSSQLVRDRLIDYLLGKREGV